MGMNATILTLGPVLFNWAPEVWRDFYFRVADEAPVDVVFVGEIVCSKRVPFIAPHVGAVVERLTAAGKRVVLSSPILVANERDRNAMRELAATAADGMLVEANDVGCLAMLAGQPHVVGPFINVYNEGTLAWLASRGAVAVALTGELPSSSLARLAGAAAKLDNLPLEVQVFGRLPLAISARCYHARAHGLHKDSCQFVCAQDADGMAVDTLDGDAFLAVNGTQTMSHAHVCLAAEVPALQAMGIGRLRLSPQTCDMVRVATIFRDVADGRRDGAEAARELATLLNGAPVANGFFHDKEGAVMVAAG
jgi:collagenase-like PrtC family protease